MRLASLVLLGIAAACSPPQVTLPAPTGDLSIGRMTVRWVDESRPEPMTPDEGDVREVSASLWYPAAAPADGGTAPYVEALSALSGVLDSRSAQALSLVEIHAASAPPVARGRFPLVLFSHGNDMLGAHYSAFVEELVSHGFVVAALEHPHDARAALLSSGVAVPYGGEQWPSLPPPAANGRPDPDTDYARYYRERVKVRARDAMFVLGRLSAPDLAGPEGQVARAIDFSRVGFAGHSVGGVAAGELCQSDARVRACMNIDGDSGNGPFYLDASGAAFSQPFLMLTKAFDATDAQLAAWGLTREQWLANLAAERNRFFGAIAGGSHRVVIEQATHQSFSDDAYVIARLERTGDDEAHLARLQLMRRYLLAFFVQHLKAEPSPLLAPGAAPPAGARVDAWPPH